MKVEISREKSGGAEIENTFFPFRPATFSEKGGKGDDKSLHPSRVRADSSIFNVSGSSFTNAAGKRSRGRRTLRQDNPALRQELPIERRPRCPYGASRLRNYHKVVNYPLFFSLSLILRDCCYVILNVIASRAKDTPGRCRRVFFPERISQARS